MNITEIKIRKTFNNESRLKALVSITIDHVLAIHDIKVIEGPDRLFVAMPSKREANGTFRDIIHPIESGTREEIERQIIDAYYVDLAEKEVQAQMTEDMDYPSEAESDEEPAGTEEDSFLS